MFRYMQKYSDINCSTTVPVLPGRDLCMVLLSPRLEEEPKCGGVVGCFLPEQGDWGPAPQVTDHKAFVQQGITAGNFRACKAPWDNNPMTPWRGR